MRSWNYRVFVQSVPTGGGDFEDECYIAEAYYDEAGNVVAMSDAVPVVSDTVAGLAHVLSLMTDACAKPALNADELRDRYARA